MKECTKPLLCEANYDRENDDSKNAVALNSVMCPRILYDIVPYARHFLPIKFFPKYYLNKLCFELPQNVTWTDQYITGLNGVRLAHHSS